MSIKELFSFPSSRLSRRIAFWVFISVILIETLIFIPSYKNREKELLAQLKQVSLARIALIMQIAKPDMTAGELFQLVKKLQDDRTVIGGTLYTSDGEKIGSFGVTPELPIDRVKPAGMTFLLNGDGSFYDIAISPAELHRDYRMILRHDASFVKKRLLAFFLRISGLVVIISLVVTVGAWLTLRWIVVNPILDLRGDLIRAGESLSGDRRTPEFYSLKFQRDDELGEVIGAFRHMYRQISDAINEREKAEAALRESFKQVEAYSEVLNNELEKGRRMQINFLPDHLLQMKGWETAAFFKPARQVAGDFYDLFQLPGGSIGIVVADVCDKGVGAALFMALFRSLIRVFSGQTSMDGLPLTCSDMLLDEAVDLTRPPLNPSHMTALKAVQLTNKYIALNHGDLAMFATLFFGILDPDSGVLSYVNGGHEPVFIVGPHGGVKAHLTATGPAVGIEPKIDFKIQQTQLDPGDILLGYTDGVTEALASKRRVFYHAKFDGDPGNTGPHCRRPAGPNRSQSSKTHWCGRPV